MQKERQVIYEGMCYVIPLSKLRETHKVHFHYVPILLEEGIGMIHRVLHEPGALSPSVHGRDDIQPWYMHPHQEDNAMILEGKRVIDLYTKEHGVQTFEATAEQLIHNGEVIIDEPYIFGWHTNVFHRPNSPEGSISIFITRHLEGFNLDTEFNIYDLDTKTGEYELVREGHLDQPVIERSE